MSETKGEYRVRARGSVISQEERRSSLWLSSAVHAKLKALSLLTGLPLQTIGNVLIELGLPYLTKELVADLKSERGRYIRERFHTKKGHESYGPVYDKDTRA